MSGRRCSATTGVEHWPRKPKELHTNGFRSGIHTSKIAGRLPRAKFRIESIEETRVRHVCLAFEEGARQPPSPVPNKSNPASPSDRRRNDTIGRHACRQPTQPKPRTEGEDDGHRSNTAVKPYTLASADVCCGSTCRKNDIAPSCTASSTMPDVTHAAFHTKHTPWVQPRSRNERAPPSELVFTLCRRPPYETTACIS